MLVTIPSEDQMQWPVLKYHKCLPPRMLVEPEAAFRLSGKTSLSSQVWSHTAGFRSEVNRMSHKSVSSEIMRT